MVLSVAHWGSNMKSTTYDHTSKLEVKFYPPAGYTRAALTTEGGGMLLPQVWEVEPIGSSVWGYGDEVDYYGYMDLSVFVTGLLIVESKDAPYGYASLDLTIDQNTLMSGMSVLGGGFRRGTQLGHSNMGGLFSAGGWILIRSGEGSSDTQRTLYFGWLEGVSSNQVFAPNGVAVHKASLRIGSFLSPAISSQIKFTPVAGLNSKDSSLLQDVLGKINNAFISNSGDYTTGFLGAVKSSFNLTTAIPTWVELQRVVETLLKYPLPDELGGGYLGDVIRVWSGYDFGDFNLDELKGNPADVITDYLTSRINSFNHTVINHMDLINSIFNPFPFMIELFPRVIPARQSVVQTPTYVPEQEIVRPLTPFEEATGCSLILVYRFKPCTPKYAPTQKGYTSYIEEAWYPPSTPYVVNEKTASELYFGETLDKTPYREIDESEVLSISMNYQDSDRINAIFVENPFTTGDAHKSTLVRAGAPFFAEVDDVNAYGLRCLSATNPFYVSGASSPASKARYKLSLDAIPERLFHTIAMDHLYSSGSFTLHTDTNTPKVGEWVHITGMDFWCYVISTSVSIQTSRSGVVKKVTQINYHRGSKGALIPLPTNGISGSHIDPENMRLLKDLTRLFQKKPASTKDISTMGVQGSMLKELQSILNGDWSL